MTSVDHLLYALCSLYPTLETALLTFEFPKFWLFIGKG